MYYLSDCCLLCLDSKNLKSVLIHDDNDSSVEEELKCCLPEIMISKSQIPEFICYSCRTTVQAFYNFRKMSLANYKRLMQYTQILKESSDPRGQKFTELQIQIHNLDLMMEREQVVKSDLNVKEEMEDSLESLEENDQATVADDDIDTKEEFQMNNQELLMKQEQSVDSKLNVKDEVEDSLEEYDKKSVAFDTIDIEEEFVADSEVHEFDLKHLKEESEADNEEDSVSRSSCEDDNQPEVVESNFSADTDNANTTNNKTDSGGAKLKRKKYKCSICKKGFSARTSMVRHLKVHVGMENFKCQICDEKFLQITALRSHMKLHLDCYICNKQFKREPDLRRHLKSHSGIRDFKCPVCEKLFVLKGNLTSHLKLHYKVRDTKCSICDKEFQKEKNLKNHMKNHYYVRNMYKCFLCDKQFLKKKNLDRHINSHYGIKDFKCSACNKDFIGKAALSRHQNMHAKQEILAETFDNLPYEEM